MTNLSLKSVGVLAALLLATASAAQDSGQAPATTPPTDNFSAANGPLPGDLAQAQKDWECSQGLYTPGYFKALNGAEVADSNRSQAFPCATFLGSMDGNNTVYAYRSEDSYQGVLFMNNRRPGELYLTGGNNPPAQGVVPAGPFVAKVNPDSGKEIWRTYLQNANVSGDWTGAANLNILPDGNIPISFGNQLVKLDGDSGLILNHVTLPADAPAEGSNFKHMTIAPDGTLILKNQTRATPCNIQGTLAAFQCPGGVAASPVSTIHAVNPDTLEIYDSVSVPSNAVSPHSITVRNGTTYIYVTTVTNFYRFIWDADAKQLSQDMDWVVENYLEDGQTAGDAASTLGDWVVVQVNGLPSQNAASAIVAIHQDDPTRLTRIYPFGTDLPTGMSWAPPKAAIDAENSMVFSNDQNMMKIGGLNFDQDTGEFEVAWTMDGATTALQTLIGPADQRVLGTARAQLDVTQQDLMQTSNPPYKQQAIWLNAKTGEVLAESDFVEPMNFNTMLAPGYGGRFYYMWDQGFIIFQVMPTRE
jgi:outer membrane protein assembly factor BamB